MDCSGRIVVINVHCSFVNNFHAANTSVPTRVSQALTKIMISPQVSKSYFDPSTKVTSIPVLLLPVTIPGR